MKYIVYILIMLTVCRNLLAANISTTWNGYGDWSDSAKWSNGTANNDLSNTYSTLIATGGVTLTSNIEIDDLSTSAFLTIGSGGLGVTLSVKNDAFVSTQTLQVSTNSVFTVGGNLNSADSVYLNNSTAEVGGSVFNTDDFVGFQATASTLLVHGDFVNVTKHTSSTFSSQVELSTGSQFQIEGNLTNNGTLSSSYSTINVAKQVTNTGDFTIEQLGTSKFAGDLINSGTFRISYSPATVEVMGNLDNTGSFSTTYGGKAVVHGTLSQQVNGELTGGQIRIDGGSISWAEADIHSISKGATLTLSAGGVIRDFLTGEDGLRNLTENRGQLNIESGSTLALNGNFTNPGYISIYSGDTNALFVHGDFNNSGSYRDYGNYKTSTADTTEVTGTFNNTGDFSVVYGATALIGGAVTNSGSLSFSNDSKLTVNSSLNNTGTLSFSSNSISNILGNLNNSKALNLFNSGTLVTIQGYLDNTGSIYISNGAQIAVQGPLQQQVDGQLTAGVLQVGSDSSFQWAGADVQVLAKNAQITLSGTGSLKDIDNGNSALRNFAENQGTFQIDSGAALPIPGDFVNSGTLTSSGTGTSFALAGTMSNSGKLVTYGSGIISIHGPLTEQVGTSLTMGSLQVSSGSVIEWSGANIHSIKKGASVSLSGSGILRDIDTGSNALAALQSVSGTLSVGSGAIISTQSTLDVDGTLGIASNGTVTTAGDFTFEQTAKLSGTFAPISLSGKITGFTPWSLNISGDAILNGTLSLSMSFTTLTQISLSPSFTFVVIQANDITGVFSNAQTNGARVVLKNYTGSPMGTFAVQYTDTQVILTNFAAVPEPSTCALVILGFVFLSRFLHKRESRLPVEVHR